MNENEATEGFLRELLGRVGLRVDRVVVSGEEVAIFARGHVSPGRPPAHRGAEMIPYADEPREVVREVAAGAAPRGPEPLPHVRVNLVDPADVAPVAPGEFAASRPEPPTRFEVRLDGRQLEGGIPGLPGVPRFNIAAMARSLPSVPAPAPGSFPGMIVTEAQVAQLLAKSEPFAAYTSGVGPPPIADVDALNQLAATNPELAGQLMPNRNVPLAEPEGD